MAVNFDRRTNNPDVGRSPFNKVIFGSGATVLETELNELQDLVGMKVDQINSMLGTFIIRNVTTDTTGLNIIKNGSIKTVNGGDNRIKFGDNIIVCDKYCINLNNTLFSPVSADITGHGHIYIKNVTFTSADDGKIMQCGYDNSKGVVTMIGIDDGSGLISKVEAKIYDERIDKETTQRDGFVWWIGSDENEASYDYDIKVPDITIDSTLPSDTDTTGSLSISCSNIIRINKSKGTGLLNALFDVNCNSVIIGNNASVGGDNSVVSVAIGRNTHATGITATAVGINANANGTHSVAVGHNAIANSQNTIAIGIDTNARSQDSIAIGASSVSSGSMAVAMGYGSGANGSNSISVGRNADATSHESIAIGHNANITLGTIDGQTYGATGAIAIGYDANVISGVDPSSNKAYQSSYAIAVGFKAQSNHNESIAIGAISKADRSGSVAVGSYTNCIGLFSVAVGSHTSSNGGNSIAIGCCTVSNAIGGIAIGYNANTCNNRSIAIGDSAKTPGTVSVAIGHLATPNGGYTVAVGYNTKANGIAAVAIGSAANIAGYTDTDGTVHLGEHSIAIGDTVGIYGSKQSIAMGWMAYIDSNSDDSIAVGHKSRAVGAGSIAIGSGANTMPTAVDSNGNIISSSQTIAIGNGTKAIQNSAIAIGNGAGALFADTISIGLLTNSNGWKSIAIGAHANANGTSTIATGACSVATGANSIAIGTNTKANDGSISLGMCANSNIGGIAIGQYANSYNYYGVAVGVSSNAGANSVAVGCQSKAQGDFRVAIGKNANAAGNYSVAMGWEATANGNDSVAIGLATRAVSANSVSIGNNITANVKNSVFIGNPRYLSGTPTYLAQYYMEDGVFIGSNIAANCNMYDTGVVIGSNVELSKLDNFSNGYSTVCIGCHTTSGSDANVIIGHGASVGGRNSIAIGYYANCNGNGSVSIKNGNFDENNAITLGDYSITKLVCKVALSTTSDERDKYIIGDIEDGATEFLKKLHPIRYTRNDRELYKYNKDDVEAGNITEDEYKAIEETRNIPGVKHYYGYNKAEHTAGTKRGERVRVGLSAQEILQAMRDVYGDDSYGNIVDDDMHDLTDEQRAAIPDDVENKLTVTYENLIPFLIKSIHELSARLDAVEDAISGDADTTDTAEADMVITEDTTDVINDTTVEVGNIKVEIDDQSQQKVEEGEI